MGMRMVTADTDDFARVCALLPGLTSGQLEQVRLRTKYLKDPEDASAARAPGPRAGDDWLLRGVEAELRRRGVLGRGRLPAAALPPGWAETSGVVRADLLRVLGGRADERKTAALGQMAARAVADWLAGGGVRITARTVLSNMGKTLAAIDAQFPGYASAGLLHCCLDPRMVGA